MINKSNANNTIVFYPKKWFSKKYHSHSASLIKGCCSAYSAFILLFGFFWRSCSMKSFASWLIVSGYCKLSFYTYFNSNVRLIFSSWSLFCWCGKRVLFRSAARRSALPNTTSRPSCHIPPLRVFPGLHNQMFRSRSSADYRTLLPSRSRTTCKYP